MTRTLLLGVIGTLLCLFGVAVLGATTPQFMNYRGRLTNSLGSPIDLTTPMTFTIYADSLGGVPIWTETQDTVIVRNRIFTVRLGKVVLVSDSLFKSDRRWLEIRVGSDAPLSPRTPFVSVAYAFRSTYADSCNFIPTTDTLGRTTEAEEVFRADLARYPMNGRSLFGLCRALDASGKTYDAKLVAGDFDRVWARADTELRIEDL